MKATKILSAENRVRLRLREIARVFLGVATSTWGSGSTTIANIRRELVEDRRALGENEFSLSFALARFAPGTNVLAFCAAMGWRLRGWPGAFVAVAGLSVPAAIVVVLLTLMYERWHTLFAGAMAAVVGVICGGAFLLARPYFDRRRLVRTIAMLAACFVTAHWISPVWVLLLAGIAGFVWPDR